MLNKALQFPFGPLKSTLSRRVALFFSAEVTDKPLPSYWPSQVQAPLNSRHSTECRSSPWQMDPYWALNVTNTLSWYNGICWPCLDSICRFPLGLPVAFFQRQFLLPKWRMKYPSSKISIFSCRQEPIFGWTIGMGCYTRTPIGKIKFSGMIFPRECVCSFIIVAFSPRRKLMMSAWNTGNIAQ